MLIQELEALSFQADTLRQCENDRATIRPGLLREAADEIDAVINENLPGTRIRPDPLSWTKERPKVEGQFVVFSGDARFRDPTSIKLFADGFGIKWQSPYFGTRLVDGGYFDDVWFFGPIPEPPQK